MANQEQTGDEVRFEFGANWGRFLQTLTAERITTAERSLAEFLDAENLRGCSFVDVGSGSGLFSLAARRLGARVHSFDYDRQSVACTRELQRRFFPDDPLWTVEQGSVLDAAYLSSLGTFDVVYSWGVLHHTGQMWRALDAVTGLVAPGGKLFIAIYNDEGSASRRWRAVKRLYCSLPAALRFMVLGPALARLWGPTIARDTFRGRPLRSWRAYHQERGMSPWHDVVDWVGGYPFEVARPDEIRSFYAQRDFELLRGQLRAGRGCNEFVFRRLGG